jgi:hypothetical protein
MTACVVAGLLAEGVAPPDFRAPRRDHASRTLIIVAPAMRQAGYLADLLKRGAIDRQGVRS